MKKNKTNRADQIVVRDSKADLWKAVRDELIFSKDLTPDGKLRPSLTPTPRDSLLATPFGIQKPPTFHKPSSRRPLGEVDANVLRAELGREDVKRRAEEAAIAQIQQGLCALELARRL